ncbi:gp436 family protein [Mannheimia massilioguelmaensis]|uniref:gp436 family protein n=1 Tax=Mannheimia massilioguelmaensis TaxID=1604354 RepID=UPI0005C94C40|nr:phage protein Gp36 family protein [Mannheimia massilioguelmaensis]
MLYATRDSFINRYDERTLALLASHQDGSLNTVKVDEALQDASEMIDSYLSGRYSLPLKSAPAVLERHCCYIARYFLEKNRATEQARKDYEDSIRYLEKVASGAISLGLTETDETVESENVVFMESAGSVWARDKSKGFI